MAARPDVRALHARLAVPGVDAAFGDHELAQLPGPVAQYFRAAVEPGTPLARAARLSMRGHVKLGARWVLFRATETLAPHHGFVWAGRAAGVITGSDHYADGIGMLDWRLFGLVTVAHAEGPEVSRSAAARAGGEAVWLPTTLLPRFDVTWDVASDTEVIASYRVGDVDIANQLTIDEAGRLRTARFSRWGTPTTPGPSRPTPSASKSPDIQHSPG